MTEFELKKKIFLSCLCIFYVDRMNNIIHSYDSCFLVHSFLFTVLSVTQSKRMGITVAGGFNKGSEFNQLSNPLGLYVDDDQTIFVADYLNHRVMEWKDGATSGIVIAGGKGPGNGSDQLHWPQDVILGKNKKSLIICDRKNRRVVRWPRRNGTRGETIISNIDCFGLTMDENGSLYAADNEKHEVRRFGIGDSEGTVVAGGNRKGNSSSQLSGPRYVFVDPDHSLYVSDWENHRVMKWQGVVKEGKVVAGGHEEGNSLKQLHGPRGVAVDQLGTVYVADSWNNRVIRWPKGATQGSLFAGGVGQGSRSDQLNWPCGLSLDQHGNLYVVDNGNHRVQKFSIK